MTNTLTWDIKPIAFPKINSNLLSVISLIVLLTMTFTAASVIASHCYPEILAVEAAQQHVNYAYGALAIAKGVHWAAILSANLVAIGFASAGVIAAGYYLSACQASLKAAEAALKRCQETPHPDHGSSSNGSGSNGSGSNGSG